MSSTCCPTCKDERGATIVIVALVMVVMLIFAGFAIDGGNARQSQRHASAVADSSALSAATALGVTVPGQDPFSEGFHYAFKSLGVTDPLSPTSCGTNCEAETSGAYVVQLTTPYSINGGAADPSYVHAQVCWTLTNQFGAAFGVRTETVCGRATAQNTGSGAGAGSGGGGGTGQSQTSCTHNELTNVSAINSNLSTSQTISAEYSATVPLDTTNPNSIVFIGPISPGGQLVRLSAPGGAAPTYALTDKHGPNGAMTDVVLSYVVPSGLATASASLFVTDIGGNDCGQAAWSTCGVDTHDGFFEPDQGTHTGDHGGNESGIYADADDYISPAAGTAVNASGLSSVQVSALFYDETQYNPARLAFFVDGSAQKLSPSLALGNVSLSDATQVNSGAGNSILPTDTTDPANGYAAQPIGSPSPAVSVIPNLPNGLALVQDFLGDPLAGITVKFTPTGSTTATTVTGVSDNTGNVPLTLPTDTKNETVTYTVTGAGGTNGTVTLGTSQVTFAAGAVVSYTPFNDGKPAQSWTSDNNPYGGGSQDYLGRARTGATYQVRSNALVPTVNGWHSAFVYTFDLDQNQNGGDCSMVQFAFSVFNGSAPNGGSIRLVQ